MLKKGFQEELNKLAKLNYQYKEQLNKVVDKIGNEFGKTPYDIDCDYFIDTYCVGTGNITVNDLNMSMKIALKRKHTTR